MAYHLITPIIKETIYPNKPNIAIPIAETLAVS